MHSWHQEYGVREGSRHRAACVAFTAGGQARGIIQAAGPSIHRRPPWGWSRQHPRAPREGGGGGLRCTLLVLSCRLFLGSSTSSLAHVPARDLPRAVWFEVDLSAVRVRLVGCRLSARAPYGWRLAWARAYFPPVNLGFIRFERKINDLNSEGLIFTSVI